MTKRNEGAINRTDSKRLSVKRSTRRAKEGDFWGGLWAWVGGGVLVVTTIVWAYLGSQINLANADQLVNVFLLDDSSGMQTAQLPAQHTFLLKIPLLWLVHILGSTSAAFTIVTIGTVLATIGVLMAVLYRIVRSPLRFGMVCMALASILLVVPAQPAPGILLPVNMAMLTTRNIEYVLFVVSIVLLAQEGTLRIKSWRLWLATFIGAILIASDKLFLPFYIGAPIVLLLAYGLYRRRDVMMFALRWLLGGLAATVLSMIGTFLVATFVVHVVGASVTSYSLGVREWRDLLVGAGYAVLGLCANLGLNPSVAPLGIGNLASQLVGLGWLIVAFNAATVGSVVAFTGRFVARMRKVSDSDVAWPQLLFLALLSTTAVAVVAYVATNHYYPVDARYLGISFFAVAVGLSIAIRDWEWVETKRVAILPILLAGVVVAVFVSSQTYRAEAAELAPTLKRNKIVAAAVQQHNSPILVGDYWRVVPTQLEGRSAFRALPLDNCTHSRQVLSNAQLSARFSGKQSFAYLLSFDNHSPDFPNCTLDEVVAAFGQPNKSVVVDGTRDDPKELLLFYDEGMRPSVPGKAAAATILPLNIDELAAPSCQNGRTIVSVVAHQDDDLLFMNPDHMHALRAGDCIRTIYLTAGDAGADQLYWIGREKGSEAAYDLMIDGKKHTWNDQVVRLPNGAYIIVATPDNTSRVSLIFMRLPDGNIDGGGFKATAFQSLHKLQSGKIPRIQTVNKQSNYTKDTLVESLGRLMELYRPDEVDTQAPINLGKRYADHSDHILAGQFAKKAFEQYQSGNSTSSMKYYIGYPIHGNQPNVFGQDYQTKGAVFFMYAKYDPGACTTFAACSNHSVYGEYLRRQYEYKVPE